MRIDISPSAPAARALAGAPIFALGVPLVVTARVTNDAAGASTLQDPRTSQKTLIRLRSPGRRERSVAELNPSRVDLTGEVTAPPSDDLTLGPGDAVDVTVDLGRLFPDRRFVTGWFELAVEYGDAVSPQLVFGVEWSPGSVPGLVEFGLDEAADPSVRGQVLGLLSELSPGPALMLGAPGEDPAQARVRELINRENADAYLASWPQLANTEPLRRFFAARRLPPP